MSREEKGKDKKINTVYGLMDLYLHSCLRKPPLTYRFVHLQLYVGLEAE